MRNKRHGGFIIIFCQFSACTEWYLDKTLKGYGFRLHLRVGGHCSVIYPMPHNTKHEARSTVCWLFFRCAVRPLLLFFRTRVTQKITLVVALTE